MDQPRVYISYSRQDVEFVRQLVAALRSAGADVWIDEEGLSAGQAWARSIERELSTRNVFIVVISHAALKSQWVEVEIQYALVRSMKSTDLVILPLVIEQINATDMPILLQTRQWISGSPSEIIGRTLATLRLTSGTAVPQVSSPPHAWPFSSSDERLAGLLARGDELREQGEYAEALTLYDEATRLEPLAPNAWAVKGAVLASLGRPDDAVEAFDEALRLSPDFVQVWRSKAELLRSIQRNDEVVDACEHALALDPGQIAMWTLKGYALWQLGRYNESASAYARALELEPMSVGDMAKSIRAIIRRLGVVGM